MTSDSRAEPGEILVVFAEQHLDHPPGWDQADEAILLVDDRERTLAVPDRLPRRLSAAVLLRMVRELWDQAGAA